MLVLMVMAGVNHETSQKIKRICQLVTNLVDCHKAHEVQIKQSTMAQTELTAKAVETQEALGALQQPHDAMSALLQRVGAGMAEVTARRAKVGLDSDELKALFEARKHR